MLNKETIDILIKPFEAKDIKKRQGSFGKTLDYIEGHKVIQRLNKAFGQHWSFEIQSYINDQDHIIVHGILTVPVLNANGDVIDRVSKHAFGGKKVGRVRTTNAVLDLGADVKAATTDALKKAATLLGVGLDLYGADDDLDVPETKDKPKEAKADKPAEPDKPASDAQKSAIKTICATKKLDIAEVLKKNDVATIEGITESKAKEIISSLNRG